MLTNILRGRHTFECRKKIHFRNRKHIFFGFFSVINVCDDCGHWLWEITTMLRKKPHKKIGFSVIGRIKVTEVHLHFHFTPVRVKVGHLAFCETNFHTIHGRLASEIVYRTLIHSTVSHNGKRSRFSHL